MGHSQLTKVHMKRGKPNSLPRWGIRKSLIRDRCPPVTDFVAFGGKSRVISISRLPGPRRNRDLFWLDVVRLNDFQKNEAERTVAVKNHRIRKNVLMQPYYHQD
jgi:hypothetical protein